MELKTLFTFNSTRILLYFLAKMNAFRVLLLDIAQQLRTDDLERLKYACSGFIPAGRAEFITRPHELFLELEKMGKLSESNRDFLAVILVQIGRNDLRNKLLEIPGKL